MKIKTGTGQGKILFVDDQPLTRISVGRLLTNYDFDITTAGTGKSALAHLNCEVFDLCILDICLPDIDGLTLMKVVQEISPSLPIIIVSGYSLDALCQKSIEEKTFGLIAKPFEVNFFVSKVQEAIHCPKDKFSRRQGSFLPDGDIKRRSVRKPLKMEVNFSFSYFTKMEEEGARKISKQELQGNTTNVSEGGFGLQTNFPFLKNHIITMSGEWEKNLGVIKWSFLENLEICNCGVKFI